MTQRKDPGPVHATWIIQRIKEDKKLNQIEKNRINEYLKTKRKYRGEHSKLFGKVRKRLKMKGVELDGL